MNLSVLKLWCMLGAMVALLPMCLGRLFPLTQFFFFIKYRIEELDNSKVSY